MSAFSTSAFRKARAPPADTGKLLGLRIGLRHERTVADWCEEAIDALVRHLERRPGVAADRSTGTRQAGSRNRLPRANGSGIPHIYGP